MYSASCYLFIFFHTQKIPVSSQYCLFRCEMLIPVSSPIQFSSSHCRFLLVESPSFVDIVNALPTWIGQKFGSLIKRAGIWYATKIFIMILVTKLIYTFTMERNVIQ